MPTAQERPSRPCRHIRRENAAKLVPLSTRMFVSVLSGVSLRARLSTTTPRMPRSATRMLLPLPRMNSGSPDSRVMRATSPRPSALRTVTKISAGPPIPKVVWRERRSSRRMSPCAARAAASVSSAHRSSSRIIGPTSVTSPAPMVKMTSPTRAISTAIFAASSKVAA